MRGNRVPENKSNKGLTVIAFFLGVLMGIILVLGSVAGMTYFALNADLDKVLGIFGLDNSADEDGKHKYINTDEDGVQNLLELISKLYAMSSDSGNLTLGQIDDLVPATEGLVNKLLDAFSEYIIIDYAELREVKFSELGTYVEDIVMDLQPAAFIDGWDIKDSMNVILEMILYGIEANCVQDPMGNVYPLYVDNFRYDSASDGYLRLEDNAPLLKSQEEYLVRESGDHDTYDLFFYSYDLPVTAERSSGGAENYFIAERDPDNVLEFIFTATETDAVAHYYGYMYSEETAETTGNYYRDNNGEKHILDPVTIRSLMEGGGIGALEKVLVLELIKNDGEQNELLQNLLGDLSLGALMNGKFDFEERINSLKIGALLNIDPLKEGNELLTYFAYGITDLTPTEEDGIYSAVYKLDGEDTEVKVTIENGKISKIENAATGERLSGTTVKTIDKVIDNIENLTLSTVMEINSDSSKILQRLADCKIGELADEMENLTLADVIDIDDSNKILKKLADYKISEMANAIDDLALSDVIDIDDSAIMAYLAFGIRQVNSVACTAMFGTKVVYLKIRTDGSTGKKYILGVYEDGSYTTEVAGASTKINDITSRIDGMLNELTIGEIIDVDDTNTILNAIKDSTINGIGDTIDKLTINELYYEQIYSYETFTDNGDGQYNEEDDGPKTTVPAKMRRAVSGEPSNDDQIQFNENYLYYTKDGDKYTLVEDSGDGRGKLKSLPATGEYYTYGECRSVWTLILNDENGSEKAISMNGIGSVFSSVSENLKNSTLSDLDKAGIFDFTDEDLKIEVTFKGEKKKLGELPLNDALTVLVDLARKASSLGIA